MVTFFVSVFQLTIFLACIHLCDVFVGGERLFTRVIEHVCETVITRNQSVPHEVCKGYCVFARHLGFERKPSWKSEIVGFVQLFHFVLMTAQYLKKF